MSPAKEQKLRAMTEHLGPWAAGWEVAKLKLKMKKLRRRVKRLEGKR